MFRALLIFPTVRRPAFKGLRQTAYQIREVNAVIGVASVCGQWKGPHIAGRLCDQRLERVIVHAEELGDVADE